MAGPDERTPEDEPTERERELQERADELQRQLDEANANLSRRQSGAPAATRSRMPGRRAEGFVALGAGDPCPLCRVGVLYKIAEAPKSVTLRCFNCNRQGSHNPEVGHKLHTTSPRETPTGLTLSRAQFEAQRSESPEEAAAHYIEPEAGSGVQAGGQVTESG